jgi:hypothetical protein
MRGLGLDNSARYIDSIEYQLSKSNGSKLDDILCDEEKRRIR